MFHIHGVARNLIIPPGRYILNSFSQSLSAHAPYKNLSNKMYTCEYYCMLFNKTIYIFDKLCCFCIQLYKMNEALKSLVFIYFYNISKLFFRHMKYLINTFLINIFVFRFNLLKIKKDFIQVVKILKIDKYYIK